MESKSQAGQDIFVFNITSGKKNGTFMEVGGHHPVNINNTYALEEQGWTGFSFDINPSFETIFKTVRKCKFIVADMTNFKWDDFLIQYDLAGKTFDYLSFDIDEASLPALRIFPFDKIRFNVMTIEHDRYRFGQEVADNIRDIVLRHNYEIVCKDVTNDNFPYEDWYVHRDYILANPQIEKYKCENKSWIDIINSFKER